MASWPSSRANRSRSMTCGARSSPSSPSCNATPATNRNTIKSSETLKEDTIQNLIDRELIVKEFYKKKEGRMKCATSRASYVDNSIAERLLTEFDGRPLQVPRLPSRPRHHDARLSQRGRGRHRLKLHAQPAAEIAKHRQPVKIEQFTTRTRTALIRTTKCTCA